MSLKVRLGLAAAALVATTGALYACSTEETSTQTPGNDAGNDPVDPEDDGGDGETDAGTDAPVGPCLVIDDGGPNLPDLSPRACQECMAAKCCAQIGACFGTDPADAGLDGSDGVKTQCMIAGECSDNCTATSGGAACAGQCEDDYGAEPLQHWYGYWQCRTDNCDSVCN